MILLSSVHQLAATDPNIKNKPDIVLYYNTCKGGVDTLDHMVKEYTARRTSRCWSFTVFGNLIDVIVIATCHLYIGKRWMVTKCTRETPTFPDPESLVLPLIQRRPQSYLSNITREAIDRFQSSVVGPRTIEFQEDDDVPQRTKKRCYLCPSNPGGKQKQVCDKCHQNICGEHWEVRRMCNNCK